MRFEKRTVICTAVFSMMAVLMLAGPARAGHAKKGPPRVFLLAGQSNMEGHAELRTIDFLGEDPDKERAALLKKFKPDGKTLVKRDDVWVVSNGAVFDKLQPGLGAQESPQNSVTRPVPKIGPSPEAGSPGIPP